MKNSKCYLVFNVIYLFMYLMGPSKIAVLETFILHLPYKKKNGKKFPTKN